MGRVMVAAMLVLAAVPARAEGCSPEALMTKVGTLTELLAGQMQQPAKVRRATAERMRAAMRGMPAAGGYDGVCSAYDALIAQVRR